MDTVEDGMVVNVDIIVCVGFGGGRVVLAMDGCSPLRRVDKLWMSAAKSICNTEKVKFGLTLAAHNTYGQRGCGDEKRAMHVMNVPVMVQCAEKNATNNEL